MSRNRSGLGSSQVRLPSQYPGGVPAFVRRNAEFSAGTHRHVQKHLWGQSRGNFRSVGNFGATAIMG